MSKGRLIQGVKHALPDCIVKSSRGSYVTTECNRKFLDFTTGIGVTNLGHSHPRVTASVTAACENIVHAQQNIMRHRPMMNLIDKLSSLELSERAGLDSWFFWNSGAEAVEAAIKMSRQSTGKPNVIVANLGYHGRTYGTMALTTSGAAYRTGFGPLMGGVFVAQFPYLSRGPYAPSGQQREDKTWAQSVEEMSYYGGAPEDTVARDVKRCLESVELMLRTQTAPSETACILLEPVLGEGGYLPCPPGYLQGLRDICDRHNILLVVDEVQSGFGRTGSMFALDWLDGGGVQPDILICAKGIANGFPLSAIGTRSEISARQTPGGMGGTYGGNAISCAAALAVLDVFKEEDILGNCMKREQEMRSRLGTFFGGSKNSGVLREVRGRGLMIGVEFESLPGKGPGETSAAVAKACHERDLLVLPCGPYDTLRFIPPLNISSKELNDGMDIFCDAVDSVVSQAK